MKNNSYKKYIYYLLTLIVIAVAYYNLKILFINDVPKDSEKLNQTINLTNDRLEIEIQNGCGVDNLARKYSLFLQSENRLFDILETCDAPHEYNESIIYVHKKNIDKKINILTEILGIKEKNIINKLETKKWDATIIIGNDYNQLKSYNIVFEKHN